MQITGITVAPVDEAKLRAYVNITIDNCFMVRGLKIIRGNSGLFVAMPNKKSKNGMFRDIAHPLDADTRKMIEDRVIHEYESVIHNGPPAEGGNGGNGGNGGAPDPEFD